MGVGIFEMNRRNFLKLLGVSPVLPSILMAKEKVRIRTPKELDGAFVYGGKLFRVYEYPKLDCKRIELRRNDFSINVLVEDEDLGNFHLRNHLAEDMLRAFERKLKRRNI